MLLGLSIIFYSAERRSYTRCWCHLPSVVLKLNSGLASSLRMTSPAILIRQRNHFLIPCYAHSDTKWRPHWHRGKKTSEKYSSLQKTFLYTSWKKANEERKARVFLHECHAQHGFLNDEKKTTRLKETLSSSRANLLLEFLCFVYHDRLVQLANGEQILGSRATKR